MQIERAVYSYQTSFFPYYCTYNVLDPMGAIIPRMPRKRQKVSYIDRLLELGIITDKKQCRKKRQRKNAKSAGTDDDKSNGKLLNNFTLLCFTQAVTHDANAIRDYY